MPEHDGLMRVFWPLDTPRTDSPGIIVGWRNSGLDVFVLSILEEVEVSEGMRNIVGLADLGLGTKRGECLEGRDVTSKCRPSLRSNIPTMRTVLNTGPRPAKYSCGRHRTSPNACKLWAGVEKTAYILC